ncbi:DUF2141 domain-containing protein [Candidatus Sulfidibacterium hydrothermale]|uniref:DUF2141 domain-containing protein n=1 Tax=Candidatus Sulfidibacterium hydrothermale TaxID=2875962 RepID=UPI001F0B4351|nr:DUF2141 domain-containing protein [Candidatus Sulfidibacterium hydrothermale]UBM62825.1 DUF2141 domain-containing protein [Candidatus Sulfidibacterium hydrothermale]
MIRNLFVLFFLGISFPIIAQQAKLTIIVSGIMQEKGIMEAGIYHTPENFPQTGKQFRVKRIPVNTDTVTFTFTLPAEKDYAVAVYHDTNKNRECDKNFLGIPKEKFGFSNNVRPGWGPPSFEEAKFPLHKDTTIYIHLIKMFGN